MAGDVPDKYYVVQNNEVIRIKYLLVYVQKSSPSRYNIWYFSSNSGRKLTILHVHLTLLIVETKYWCTMGDNSLCFIVHQISALQYL